MNDIELPVQWGFYRIPADLKPYLVFLEDGIDMLMGDGYFPPMHSAELKRTRVRLPAAVAEQIQLLKSYKKTSANQIVIAALMRAKKSKLRPAAAGQDPQPGVTV